MDLLGHRPVRPHARASQKADRSWNRTSSAATNSWALNIGVEEGSSKQSQSIKGLYDLGSGVMVLGALGSLYALSGEREKGQQILDQLREVSARRYVPRCIFAMVYAGMGESDRSFEYLDQARDQHEGVLPFYLRSTRWLFPELSSDPRYADLLRRIGLPMLSTVTA